MTEKPVQILFGEMPETPRAFSERLRVMAAVTTPGRAAHLRLTPEGMRALAGIIGTAADMIKARAAGEVMLRSEVQAAIDLGSREAAAFFKADVDVQLERPLSLGHRLSVSVLCAAAALAFAAGLVWGDAIAGVLR